eukprot:CAMPEP_0205822704 /NCGR_PEP_ID=MMETSP0206-20130828/13668_1 /ASSEMBLY_ACC=CAM_ASM_000279 /TAXON_ID=36767 /ORGANISM="Euplotes focardii, Strain TN1" /LENGTH=42 /DNA_ID= /DNA_START= /DNA_END= /DNA_ORIENTATION=
MFLTPSAKGAIRDATPLPFHLAAMVVGYYLDEAIHSTSWAFA